MKYLVNQSTKEHIVYNDDKMSPVGIWRIVEADDEGWIPWSGGECPLPDDARCNWLTRGESIFSAGKVTEKAGYLAFASGAIIAYRPILSETAEKEEPRRPGRTIAFIPPTEHNVFTRLHEATAAAESIPGIIKEIDELLAPAGYCVARRQVEPSGIDELTEKVMDGKMTPNKERQIQRIVRECEKDGIMPERVIDAIMRGLL